MKQSSTLDQIRPWLSPAAVILLGLILVFRPDSVTSTLSAMLAIAICIVGIGMVVTFFRSQKDFVHLAVGIILAVLGINILRQPLLLARYFGRFIGVLLLLGCIRENSGKPVYRNGRIPAALSGILGVFLLLVPLSASRLLISLCGGAVLLLGILMIYDRVQAKRLKEPDEWNIIDAQ